MDKRNNTFTHRHAKKIKFAFNFLLASTLLSFAIHGYAEDAQDLLAGTADPLIATIKGSGKKFIYVAEFAVAIYSFIKTRNPMVATGVVVIVIMMNVIFKIAGF